MKKSKLFLNQFQFEIGVQVKTKPQTIRPGIMELASGKSAEVVPGKLLETFHRAELSQEEAQDFLKSVFEAVALVEKQSDLWGIKK